MEKIELTVTGLSYSQSHSGAYALVLSEKNGKRRLPVVVGSFEAQSMAVALENITPPRPLTHDVLKNIIDQLGAQVVNIVIYNLLEGVFHALINLDVNGRAIEIDSRTSDAIALALRVKCPIYTYEFILNTAGVYLEEEDLAGDDDEDETSIEDDETFKEIARELQGEFAGLTESELEEALQKALDVEDYEKASKIRDEIDKRKKQ